MRMRAAESIHMPTLCQYDEQGYGGEMEEKERQNGSCALVIGQFWRSKGCEDWADVGRLLATHDHGDVWA